MLHLCCYQLQHISKRDLIKEVSFCRKGTKKDWANLQNWAPTLFISICFWSSNFVFDQDLRNFKLGQNNYNFVAQNYKYSSTGCMVSWLAVSLEMDAPKNLGFGNISAPRKRLNYFQVVWWTKLLDLWLLSMSSSQLVLSFYFCFRDFDHCLCPQVFT